MKLWAAPWARHLGMAMALIAGGSFSTEVFAQSRPAPSSRLVAGRSGVQPKADRVAVEVLCVRATNTNNRVDGKLEPMLRQLKYTRFTGFSLVGRHELRLASGQSGDFELEGNRKVNIEMLSRDESEARLRIRMFNPQGRQQLDTTVTIHRDRSFMVAGPHIGDDVLILPVTVRY